MSPLERRLQDFARGLLRPPPKQSPTEWALEHVVFEERDYRGPFLLDGAEYLREPLDDFANKAITDCVECWGSQSKKTGMLMAGAAWRTVHDPCGILWVMPSRDLAGKFSKERLQTMLLKTVPELVPRGAARHKFSTFNVQLGSGGIYLVGSNSPASLASAPCSLVVLDEVEKFDEGTQGEADAVNLAEQRTKNALWPQRRKTSTPALLEGLIWQEFLKGDQRRWFVPCPHCGREVVLVWSQTYTVLKSTGCDAYVVWDKEAKRADGSWDLDRVQASARAQCPHCGGHIRDGHKAAMNKQGVWRPTATVGLGSGVSGLGPRPQTPDPRARFTSRHLPSLYSTAPSCGFGAMARRFLEQKKSLLGLQGFINGDLAEPYVSQDTVAARVELITRSVEVTAEWQKLLTVDCQYSAPHFWWVKRAWNGDPAGGGNSEGIAAGSADTWEELRSVQTADGIPDTRVFVDSGFGAKSDSEVYKNCARFSELLPLPDKPGMALALGWIPTKGMPGRKRWKDTESGLFVPWYLAPVDPYAGTAAAGVVTMNLLEFSGDFFKDVLASLRAGRGPRSHRWTVPEAMASEEYWRHLDAEVKTAVFSPKTGRTVHTWLPRSKHWPNHLFDCEVLQVAGASFLRFFSLEEA